MQYAYRMLLTDKKYRILLIPQLYCVGARTGLVLFCDDSNLLLEKKKLSNKDKI